MIDNELSSAVGVFAIRCVAGILFFFQGYDKVFRIKTEGVLNTFSDALAKRHISKTSVRMFIAISSFIELVGGLLLAVGLFREPVIYLLTANMIGVALGFSILKPVWDMAHYFPRFVLLSALMFIPEKWDKFCLDSLFR